MSIDCKLLSDKQIKFKEFGESWNRFHKALPRDSFKIFFGKDVVLYEIHSKKIEGDEYLLQWSKDTKEVIRWNDRQYNDQKDKQWSTKHYTEN
jgi:hypothetical protein